MTFPLSEMKQESIHGPKFICYSNVSAREQLQKQTARVHNMLCEGIIMQERCVKNNNLNFQNLEKKK
jgi:hypothetical protein